MQVVQSHCSEQVDFLILGQVIDFDMCKKLRSVAIECGLTIFRGHWRNTVSARVAEMEKRRALEFTTCWPCFICRGGNFCRVRIPIPTPVKEFEHLNHGGAVPVP